METFVFHIKWQRIMRDFGLSGDDIASVYDALADYVENGSTPCLTETARMAFTFIVNQIDADKTKYNEVRAKRSEAGKKGMQHRYQDNANDNKSNKTNKCYQDETNITSVTDNVYVYDNDIYKKNISNEILKKGSKKIDASKIDDISFEFVPVMQNWFAYKQSKRQAYKSMQSATKCYKQLYELSNGDSATAEKIVNQSIANNWAGLFEIKTPSSNGTNWKSYQQQERDYKKEQYDRFEQNIVGKLSQHFGGI